MVKILGFQFRSARELGEHLKLLAIMRCGKKAADLAVIH